MMNTLLLDLSTVLQTIKTRSKSQVTLVTVCFFCPRPDIKARPAELLPKEK